MEKHGERQSDGSFKFRRKRPPREAKDFLRSLTPEMANLDLVPVGEVLEKELVEYALETPGTPIELTGQGDQE